MFKKECLGMYIFIYCGIKINLIMKKYQLSIRILSILLLSLIVSCQKPEKKIEKLWLGQQVDFQQLIPKTELFHMFDSKGEKIGSLTFGTSFKNGVFIARDTSLFDNGSVYETAKFEMDTLNMKTNKIKIDMSFGKNSNLDVDIQKAKEKLVGYYSIKRDTSVRKRKVDSSYTYDIVRSEILMLLTSIKLKKTDTLKFKGFAPTGLNISKAKIFRLEDETINAPYLNEDQDCEVLSLKTDGGMPNNIFWIRKKAPRQILKISVPDQGLTFNLVDLKLN